MSSPREATVVVVLESLRRFAGGEFVGDLSLAITAAAMQKWAALSIQSPSLVGDA
jgi:hypothetical protein